MKAVRAIYENGQIKPLEPMPDVKSAEVLIIVPEPPPSQESKRAPAGSDMEAELFGCGKDWWTDEVDAAVRQSFVVYKRPWEE